MNEPFRHTTLWKKSLDKTSAYSKKHPEHVEILRTTLSQSRTNAGRVAESIKSSQPGLTIHDITHLDALFETADVVVAGQIELNPLEYFVLGASILFHDLGMSLFAWQEDLQTLRMTDEYRDTAYDFLLSKLKRAPEQMDIARIAPDEEHHILASLFRDFHADKAKDLPLKSWTKGSTDLFIIENTALRESLGEKIGMIAQSHWCDVDMLQQQFLERVSAAPTGFPSEWTIDNIKIACLLRIADYIHIDDRRAPSMDFALLNPGKVSEISQNHWIFQNKLNRPLLKDGLLVYESKSGFSESESDAWWLAYHTVKSIDKEIKAVNDLLKETTGRPLAATCIKGAGDPELFAQFVKADKWTPVDTDLKISDIFGIITKLGGAHLYGNDDRVPIRELIQNASDAISAKQHFIPGFNGEIKISYVVDNEGNEWLHIEDNGIGMSKTVLLNFLLDFGKSFWKSALLRKEHPGLKSGRFAPIGRYGIGFFSIFMISSEVIVTSRSLNGEKTNELRFKNGLGSNPVFSELINGRYESGTLIKAKLLRKNSFGDKNFVERLHTQHAVSTGLKNEDNPLAVVARLIAPSIAHNLSVRYRELPFVRVVAAQDWKEIDGLTLLHRIYGVNEKGSNREGSLEYLFDLSKFIRPVVSASGTVIGRATLLKKESSYLHFFKGIVTVGGLRESRLNHFPGIWTGENLLASRQKALPECTYEQLLPWLKDQYQLLLEHLTDFSEKDQYEIAAQFHSLGILPRELPVANTKTGFFTYNQLVASSTADHYLIRPVIHKEEEQLELVDNILYSKFSYPENGIDDAPYGEIMWSKEINKRIQEMGLDVQKLHNPRSLFAATAQAIAEAWCIPIDEVISYSMLSLTKWAPRMNTYKTRNGVEIEETVLIIINPQKTTRKEVAKKYEKEIKKWIGVENEKDFNVEDFF